MSVMEKSITVFEIEIYEVLRLRYRIWVFFSVQNLVLSVQYNFFNNRIYIQLLLSCIIILAVAV